jgi:hypothetical protein
MNETIGLAAWGFGIAVALVAGFHVLTWLTRQKTLAEAGQIARSLSNDLARLQRSPELKDKLLRYRLSKVRASFGAPTALIEAAADLVGEYRISGFERQMKR